jgi:hypothetical protein
MTGDFDFQIGKQLLRLQGQGRRGLVALAMGLVALAMVLVFLALVGGAARPAARPIVAWLYELVGRIHF